MEYEYGSRARLAQELWSKTYKEVIKRGKSQSNLFSKKEEPKEEFQYQNSSYARNEQKDAFDESLENVRRKKDSYEARKEFRRLQTEHEKEWKQFNDRIQDHKIRLQEHKKRTTTFKRSKSRSNINNTRESPLGNNSEYRNRQNKNNNSNNNHTQQNKKKKPLFTSNNKSNNKTKTKTKPEKQVEKNNKEEEEKRKQFNDYVRQQEAKKIEAEEEMRKRFSEYKESMAAKFKLPSNNDDMKGFTALYYRSELEWTRFEEKVSFNNHNNIQYIDVPFPHTISEFFLSNISLNDKKKAIRKLFLRWHPDKFIQRYGNKLVLYDKEKILKMVTTTSQMINAAR